VEKFDAIVVGAGPAGLAATYTMAKAGLNVVIIERGDFAGSKNMMGGVLYHQPTKEVFPNFPEGAPLERHVIEQRYWLLSGDSAITFSHRNEKFAREPYNCYTVFRARIDKWFADQVREAGALLIPETVVLDILRDSRGHVIGVRTGREEGDVFADVVILADGANSLLTEKAGLRRKPEPDQMACAVKEIIALPGDLIDQRFNVTGKQGVTIEIFGEATAGMIGTGFIYTNMTSVSVGVGVLISDLIRENVNPNDLLERFKAHPAVQPLIEGGETREFLAHMIPEGGYDAMPQLCADGLLVAGDAAMMVNGLHREGSNMALTSGKYAAEAVIRARKTRDFAAAQLSYYEQLLRDSFIMKDMKKYRSATRFFENNKHFLSLYPQVANMAVEEMMTVDGTPKKEKQSKIIREVLRRRSIPGLVRDLWGMWRNLY